MSRYYIKNSIYNEERFSSFFTSIDHEELRSSMIDALYKDQKNEVYFLNYNGHHIGFTFSMIAAEPHYCIIYCREQSEKLAFDDVTLDISESFNEKHYTLIYEDPSFQREIEALEIRNKKEEKHLLALEKTLFEIKPPRQSNNTKNKGKKKKSRSISSSSESAHLLTIESHTNSILERIENIEPSNLKEMINKFIEILNLMKPQSLLYFITSIRGLTILNALFILTKKANEPFEFLSAANIFYSKIERCIIDFKKKEIATLDTMIEYGLIHEESEILRAFIAGFSHDSRTFQEMFFMRMTRKLYHRLKPNQKAVQKLFFGFLHALKKHGMKTSVFFSDIPTLVSRCFFLFLRSFRMSDNITEEKKEQNIHFLRETIFLLSKLSYCSESGRSNASEDIMKNSIVLLEKLIKYSPHKNPEKNIADFFLIAKAAMHTMNSHSYACYMYNSITSHIGNFSMYLSNDLDTLFLTTQQINLLTEILMSTLSNRFHTLIQINSRFNSLIDHLDSVNNSINLIQHSSSGLQQLFYPHFLEFFCKIIEHITPFYAELSSSKERPSPIHSLFEKLSAMLTEIEDDASEESVKTLNGSIIRKFLPNTALLIRSVVECEQEDYTKQVIQYLLNTHIFSNLTNEAENETDTVERIRRTINTQLQKFEDSQRKIEPPPGVSKGTTGKLSSQGIFALAASPKSKANRARKPAVTVNL